MSYSAVVIPLGDNFYILNIGNITSCDNNYLNLCNNATECKNIDGYWWSNNTCNNFDEPIHCNVLHQDNCLLYSGTYKAITYTHYYRLNMATRGNIFLNIAHDSGYSAIYDEDLNYVSDISSDPVQLETGNYIIKARYSSPTSGVLNAYIANQTSYNKLESIISGTYKATTFTHYYRLNMTTRGNIFLNIAHDSGYSAIYDEDLNYISDISSDPIQLETGNYIIKARYSSPTSGELSILF